MFRASHPMTDLRGGARIAGPTEQVNIRRFMETARGGGKLYSRLLTQGRPWGRVKDGHDAGVALRNGARDPTPPTHFL